MADIYLASAFSREGVGGNRAGVVLPGHGLERAEKQRIAAALGCSETVFLSPSAGADYRLEYFTPVEEVPLCGHATVAAFTVLDRLGLSHREEYTIETGAGIFAVRAEPGGPVFMEQGLPQFGEILSPEELASVFPAGGLSPHLPPRIVSTGLRDILTAVESPLRLAELKPDLAAMTALSRERSAVGVHAFALTPEGPATALCRNFAPLYGIDEESATGTANCALACYLHLLGIRRSEYLFHQGDGMGSPSAIRVRLTARGETVTGVMVGGEGYVISKQRL